MIKRKFNKVIVLFILLISIVSLSGCGGYPRVDVINSTWTWNTVCIDIDEEYKFVDFQKDYTEDGKCTIVLNYEIER